MPTPAVLAISCPLPNINCRFAHQRAVVQKCSYENNFNAKVIKLLIHKNFNRKKMTTLSIRCSDEQKEKLNEALAEYTSGEEKAGFLLKSIVNSVDADRYRQEAERIQNVYDGLQKETECIQNVNNDLQEVNKQLTADVSDLQEKERTYTFRIQELETRIQELEKNMCVELPDDKLSFTLPEPARSLLLEYARRMDVRPEEILIDMFVRYVTEQYNHWFFDFVVRKSEFKEVCGYTHAEVLNWLNSQKQ